MKNKNTLIIILLVVIIILLGYVAFLKPKNANNTNNNYQPIEKINDVVDNSPISTTLPSPYISAQNGWPPVIQESGNMYSCVLSHSEMGDTVKKTINKRDYCITTISDGAAGSIYHTYTYKTLGLQGSSKSTTFTLRYVSCGAYGGPGDAQYVQCNTAQTNFNLDQIVDSLM